MLIKREKYESIVRDKEKAEKRFNDMWNKMAESGEIIGKVYDLERENGYLSALFDQENDTEIIKLDGRLFKIQSTSLNTNVGSPDTLVINAVCVFTNADHRKQRGRTAPNEVNESEE